MRCSICIAALFVAMAANVTICFVLLNQTPTASSSTTYAIKTAPNGDLNIISTVPALPSSHQSLTGDDETATLEVIQIALSSVADGETYLWGCKTCRINAAIKPTNSFKDSTHRICRHVIIMLSSYNVSSTGEGIACRYSDGIWSLEG